MKRALITLCLSITAPLHAASTNHAYVPTASIDYSPLHHVMIGNDDGTLTPMDQPYFRSTLIAPHTWQIESDGDYAYLVEGEKEALAIDTTYGAGNIRRYMQSLTTKPLRMVANTHFHFDHTALNAYFDKALMSAATAEKATTPFPSFTGTDPESRRCHPSGRARHRSDHGRQPYAGQHLVPRPPAEDPVRG
jgi:glyoxylase-like metal-dependent hydrolase (beta-lactamase superfamily II)